MDLQEAVDSILAGTGFSNPISAQLTSLTAKANTLYAAYTPEVSALGLEIGGINASSGSTVNTSLTGLITNLPLMNSVNDVRNRIYGTTGATAEYTAAFSPLTDIPPALSGLDLALTPAIVSRLVSYTEFDPITPADASLVVSLRSQVSTVSALISNRATAATNAINGSYSLLRAYGFATFTTGTKPPYVENILNICVNARVDE